MSAIAAVDKEKVVRPMTFQVVKTKAEQALLESFAAVEGSLPGGKAVAAARREAIGRFAALGLPHRRIEEWKYTDLRNLLKESPAAAVHAPTAAVKSADIMAALGALAGHDAFRLTFVDGHFAPSLSNLKTAAPGKHVLPLSELLAKDSDWVVDHLKADASHGPIEALNVAFAADGATLRIDDGVNLQRPVVLVFARSSPAAQLVAVRNFLKFGKGSKASVIEVHMALPGAAETAVSNAATTIAVEDGATVTHVKLVEDRASGVHLSTLQARLGANATYRPFQMTIGGRITRNDIAVVYGGEGGNLDLSGAFLGRGETHIDTTLVVDHAVPRCHSRELFKGVLDGHAKGIFQGKIIVRPNAQKTDGKQMAQVLMLSPDAEFDSKPELEIYADDVVCGHGSTAAEIDEDLLFYCRSRGIPLSVARALLVESFIGEAIERIEHEAIRTALIARAGQWLGSAGA